MVSPKAVLLAALTVENLAAKMAVWRVASKAVRLVATTDGPLAALTADQTVDLMVASMAAWSVAVTVGS